MASVDRTSLPSNSASPSDSDDGGWHPGLDPSDEARLEQLRNDKTAIVEEIPSEKSSLGWYSVSCLIFNRMIGSGVFNSGGVILHNTQSVGIAMILWFVGALVAISGVILFIELGLTIPRYRIGGTGQKTPVVQSGGELPYLNYFFKRPRFFATCLFGISFILLFGNTATNSVAFARAVISASGAEQTPGSIAGIAIGMNAFACLLHSVSRKWGIRLNNFLGTVKLTMVVVMILIGYIWLGKDNTVASSNFEYPGSFDTKDSPKGVYRFAEAAIFAIFPFGGFHQANYVLAEIKHPRKNFALTSLSCVLIIVSVFLTLNALYAAIIPRDILFGSRASHKDTDLLPQFFLHTVGKTLSVGLEERMVKINAICDSLRALSAFGNVIVFTFTAAKVKQEVAKEGVLPFSLFFASSYTFSLKPGQNFGFRRLPPGSRAGYQMHSSRAPAAALGLHWTVTCILIVAVVFGTDKKGDGFDHVPAYYLFVTAYAYGLDIIWFSVIGMAMLCLRLWPGSRWRHKSPIPHWIGTTAALLFTVTNMFPLVCIWVADPAEKYLAKSEGVVPWFASQTTALCVVAASALYWVGFRFYLYQKRSKDGQELEVIRSPVFLRVTGSAAADNWSIFGFGSKKRKPAAAGLETGEEASGELVQIYEIVQLKWNLKGLRNMDQEEKRNAGRVTETMVASSSSENQDPAEGKGVMGHRVAEVSRGVEDWTMSGAAVR
ncbi:high-affinity methionine permease [Naviculisporaceae sp. PSN 640]